MVRDIKGHRYLYFWAYRPGPAGSRRAWTYVGRVGRDATRRRAAQLLLEYHVAARSAMDRRVRSLLGASGLV